MVIHYNPPAPSAPRRAASHGKAAGEKKPQAYPLGYVEDFSNRERSPGVDASRRGWGWEGEKKTFSAS